MSAAYHAVATGTADVQVVSRGCILRGFSIRESAGTPAVATVILRDGTAATDPIVAVIELAANGSVTEYFDDGISISTGVYVDRVAGETEGAVYLG